MDMGGRFARRASDGRSVTNAYLAPGGEVLTTAASEGLKSGALDRVSISRPGSSRHRTEGELVDRDSSRRAGGRHKGCRRRPRFASWMCYPSARVSSVLIVASVFCVCSSQTAPAAWANTPILRYDAIPSSTQAGGHPDIAYSIVVKNRVLQK